MTPVYARVKFGSQMCGDYTEIVKYSKVLSQSLPDKYNISINIKNYSSNTNTEL